ncbi:MAG TPA: response regulator [Candidatus Acidoferrales bacterium]|nr:response regulator [Candidatus Acidoferrales bacterium]
MSAPSSPEQKQAAPHIRVLMLEHEPADVELALKALTNDGFQVEMVVASTKPEFNEILASKSYDVVLADYRLPGWTGLEALTEIQQRSLNLPLVLVTGTLGEQTAVECIKLGVSDYVLKDHLTLLPAAVRRALEQKTVREERARYAKAREQSAANFRFLFAKNPIPMMVVDRETLRYVEANEATIQQYGYSRDEFLQLRATEIRTPEEAARLTEYLENKLADRANAGIWHHRLKDGRTIDVEIIAHETEFHGRPALLIAAINVTEKKALENQLRQAQKFEAIGQLAGGIAHDFNNMLGAILGWVELGVEDTSAESQLQSYFLKIKHQADRAAALTRQLLAFARRQILEPRNINLNSIIHEVIALLGKVIGSNIELSLLLADDLPAVKVDPTQADQVIMNLCLNARDAMPSGGQLEVQTACVEVTGDFSSIHKDAKPGLYVRLTVRDTGTGIDPANIERIFDPFFTTKGVGKGTGLGLATVYGIVKQHGGFLHVESKPDEGAQFHVYIPASSDAKAAKPDEAPAKAARGGKETILLVEDHDGLRETASATLKSLGYHVRVARDGEQAVEEFRAHCDEIALVLLDVVLPKVGGPEAYARMCAYHPDVPVLFVTGYSADAEMLHSVQERKLPLLQKPYDPRELALRVRVALDRHLVARK